jgi:alpha-beta hydrolase superfamily lysophospholipase
MFTLNGYYNMFAGLKFIASPANLSAVPKKLPVFFIAGEMDPVGNYGLGVKKAAVSLQSAGVRDVTCRLYPHDRHEVLNELNRQEVYEDVWNWISSRMAEENV